MTSLEQKIVKYLHDLAPEILGLNQCRNIEILAMTPGSYNLNYHVVIDGTRFIFRVNIRAQSGLSNQIDYEFKVMKFLEPYQITARAFYFDNSRNHFDFDILIEEYLEGSWLSLTEEGYASRGGNNCPTSYAKPPPIISHHLVRSSPGYREIIANRFG